MDDTRSRRRAYLLITALVLAAVIAAVLFFLHRSATPRLGSVPRTPAAVTSAPSAAPTPTPASGGDGTALTAAPGDVTWELFQGLALPTSPTAGPSRRNGPVVAGYAHTPEGALIAATQISARYLITPNGGWREVLDQQVVPDAGRDAFAGLRAQVSDAAPSKGYAQFVGFRFAAYSPDLAVISLANKTSAGSLQVTNTTVQWLDGDWKVQIPESGLAQPQAVQNLTGYIPWAGVA